MLVVEDNHSVGTFSIQALSELGYRTILARNGEEALGELAQNWERIHVVFSDVVMPGMSGLQLAERVRDKHPDVPVLLTSG